MTHVELPAFPEIVRFSEGCPLCGLARARPEVLRELHVRHAGGVSGAELVEFLRGAALSATRGAVRNHLVSHVQTAAIGLGHPLPSVDPSGSDIQSALDAGVPLPPRQSTRRARLSLVPSDEGAAGPGAVPEFLPLPPGSPSPRAPDPHLDTGLQEGYFDLYDRLRDTLARVSTDSLFDGGLLSPGQVGAWTSLARELRSTLDSLVKQQQAKATLDAVVQSHTRRFVVALAREMQVVVRPLVVKGSEGRASGPELAQELEHFARDTLADLIRSAADDALRETREVYRISEAV